MKCVQLGARLHVSLSVRAKRTDSCSKKAEKHEQFCKTCANLGLCIINIILLWQELALLPAHREETSTSAPNYSVQNGTREQKRAKRRRTLGKLAYDVYW